MKPFLIELLVLYHSKLNILSYRDKLYYYYNTIIWKINKELTFG